MNDRRTVFIIDPHQASRESLAALLRSMGISVEPFDNGEAFLHANESPRNGCVVLLTRLSGMSGLQVQEELTRQGNRIPVIMISANGDVGTAVRAMQNGAFDFIRRPYDPAALIQRIRQAFETDARIRREEAVHAEIASRVALLTPREHEVMLLLATGQPGREIAWRLGVSPKTIDVHRSRIMIKLRADSIVELAKMAEIAGGCQTAAPCEPAGGNGRRRTGL